MQIIAVIAVLGFIGLIAGIVFLMFLAAKKERARKVELASTLGFQPVEKPDAALTERFFTLHRYTKNSRYSLRNVFVRNTPEGQMYLYDLDDNSGESSTRVVNMGVAIVTPGRDLPRFIIYPRINLGGKLASFANRAIEWLASRNMERVEMDDRPGFEQRYIVNADDAMRAREIINNNLTNLLVNCNEMLVIHGADDSLSVSNTVSSTSGQKVTAEVLRPRIDLALAISRCLN
jgi:hypothetical protein